MNKTREIIVTQTLNEMGVQIDLKTAPLVRCKDCKHHEELLNNNDGNVLCWVHVLDVIVDRNGYCNYGERKEQDNETSE